MATRNLTVQYNRVRDCYNNNAGNYQDSNGHISIIPAPGWTLMIPLLDHEFNVVQQKIVELEKLQSQIILPEFAVKSDKQVQQFASEIAIQYSKLHDKVKNLGNGYALSYEEQCMLQNIKAANGRKLQEIGWRLNEVQKKFSNQQNQIKSLEAEDPFRYEVSSNYSNNYNNNNNVASSEAKAHLLIDIPQQSVIDMQVAVDYEQNAAMVLKSVTDLNQIFKEVSLLVGQQGTILDRIDYNIERSAQYVQHGHDVLAPIPEKIEKRRSCKLCIMLLLVAVMGLMVLLILKLLG